MTRSQRNIMRGIIRGVAQDRGISEADIYVRDRRPDLAAARRAAWAECFAAGFNKSVISRLGGWDQTTVSHGVRKHMGAI